MPFGSPWEKRPGQIPKAIEIQPEPGACPVCVVNKGVHEIPLGKTVREVMEELGWTFDDGFHPNCNCEMIVHYHESGQYMTYDQKNQVLATFEQISERYKQGNRLGFIDDLLILREKSEATNAGDIVEAIATRTRKDCLARSRELRMLFTQYLNSLKHQTQGCVFEIVSFEEHLFNVPVPIREGLKVRFEQREYGWGHAKLLFRYMYTEADGSLRSGERYYDPYFEGFGEDVYKAVVKFLKHVSNSMEEKDPRLPEAGTAAGAVRRY